MNLDNESAFYSWDAMTYMKYTSSFHQKENSQPPPPPPPPPSEESALQPPPPPPQDWQSPPPVGVRAPSPALALPTSSSVSSQRGTAPTGSRLYAELAFLRNAFKCTFVCDKAGNFTLGSSRWLDIAETRLASWISASSLEGWGYVIHAHLVALRTILKAFKAYYFDEKPDYYVCYSLFQSSIINFCNAMQSFQSYRPNHKSLYPRDLPLMDLPKSLHKCRTDLVHGNVAPPKFTDLIKQTELAYAWYTRNFWPNLSFEIEPNDDGSRIWWLTYLMNFPSVEIVDTKDWIKVDAPKLFKKLEEAGFPESKL